MKSIASDSMMCKEMMGTMMKSNPGMMNNMMTAMMQTVKTDSSMMSGMIKTMMGNPQMMGMMQKITGCKGMMGMNQMSGMEDEPHH
jgi:hypothetical protein